MTTLRLALSLLALHAVQLDAAEPAPAANTTVSLDVEVSGVRSGNGAVMVSLCGDKAGRFPGGCTTFAGAQKAASGTTVVRIANVPVGRYALQAFHDENGNGRADIPPEGYAFGNDMAWPPTFDSASVTVDGARPASVHMVYLGAPPAAAQGSRGIDPPAGVERRDLREQGLYGELYLPAGAAPHSLRPVLLLGGSEGGVETISRMAASFAQAGHAALALAYWNEQGLPQKLERIPLEYFDTAVAWLRKRPEAKDGGVGLVGWSRGAEAALLVASRNPQVRGVVAIAPSSVVWEGLGPNGVPARGSSAWTAGGSELAFVKPEASAFRPDMPALLPVFAAAFGDADARPETAIPVERIRGNVLLISGDDDRLWPSQRFADRIMARLQGAGRSQGIQHLDYRGAGHFVFVGAPDGPMARTAVAGGMMGGTPQANAAAWADNWPRTLAFLNNAYEGRAR